MGWMGIIFYLSSQTGAGGPEWQAVVAHIVEYGVLSTLFLIAIRQTTGMADAAAAGLAIGLATLYGISDEFHQSMVPGRLPDSFDVMVDLLAAGGAAGLITLFYRVRANANEEVVDS